jgi:formate hydrogenlyase transcriptional activator
MEPSELGSGGDAARYRALLHVTNATMSSLTRDALFAAIAPAVRDVVAFDRIALFAHDPTRDVLRLDLVESTLASNYFAVGLETATADSHVGRVFRTRQPFVRRDLAVQREWEIEDRAFRDGIRSYAIVPLLAHGRAIGTLAVGSKDPNRYDEADVAFLGEVANQIALAIENMTAYEEITALHAQVTDAAERSRRAEETLRVITEGTASVTGADFFRSLVRHLATALGARYAFVATCADGVRARSLAFWAGNDFGPELAYDVALTPCAKVLAGELCYYPRDVQARFPGDEDLARLGVQSYLGMPMVDVSGRVVGHLAILDDRPWDDEPAGVPILRVFAARAAAELERQHAEAELRAALAEVDALRKRLESENVYLQEAIEQAQHFEEIVGESPLLRAVLRTVTQVAATDSTVLITGETGTGKELIARAIHRQSARRDRPLVVLNCGAISAGLVESELFGHVKGAFTGALERRVGRFEVADGGTLFLDEVGELPPDTQSKLLRVLQERTFEPVGSNRSVRVDVRVIAATNRDLAAAVRAGAFRADLFYRLNVVPLAVPPLRERPGDVPLLAAYLLGRFTRRFGKRIDAIAPATLERLVAYGWPGNVRELANVIERAVVLCRGSVLELDDDLVPVVAPAPALRPPDTRDAEPPPSGLAEAMEDVERRYIQAALDRAGGIVEGPRGAARLLKLHPNTLRGRMERLGLKRPRHERS